MYYLNLAGTPTTDAGVKLLTGRYAKLAQLVLDGTKAGDPAINALSGLKELTYLPAGRCSRGCSGSST
jgi:hypothetical protein